MRFRDVVIKNFMGNIRQYLSFFLCNIFSIALFFVYATIAFNDVIFEEGNEWMSMVMPVSIVGISIFSVFFIIYAHTSFVKGRNKEFAIYLSVGMNKKELRKLVNMENLIIEAVSLICGIITGMVFSRLFQTVLLKMIDVKNAEYQLDYRAFLVTAAAFLAIFFVVFWITNIKMQRMDIRTLLTEARKSEGKRAGKQDVILGLIGLGLVLVSVGSLFVIAADEKLNSDFKVILGYTLVVFLGIFLIISKGGNMVVEMLRKSRYYYGNMLSISEIHYKYDRNKKILFTLSVLSAMSIMFIASPFSLFNLSYNIADENVHDIEYVSTSQFNNIEEKDLESILNKEEIIYNEQAEFIYLSKIQGSGDLKESIPIVSESIFYKYTKSSIGLKDGECAVSIMDWVPGDHGYTAGSEIALYDASGSYQFRILKSGHGEKMANMSFPCDAIMIINDKEYSRLKAQVTEDNIGYYHFMGYKDWAKTKDIVASLQEKMNSGDLILQSKTVNLETLKAGYGSFLFVASVLGVLFFVAGGVVLYFRQYVEYGESVKLFAKLYRIGITRKEIKKLIGKELRIIFFIPLIFGIFMGTSYIYLITNIMGGSGVLKEFMKNTGYVILMYIILQSLFYKITKAKAVSQLEDGILNTD